MYSAWTRAPVNQRVERSPECATDPPQTLSLSVNPGVALVNSRREKKPSDSRRSPASGNAASVLLLPAWPSCARSGGGVSSLVTCIPGRHPTAGGSLGGPGLAALLDIAAWCAVYFTLAAQ